MPEQDGELIALGLTVRQLRTERNITEGELATAAGLTLERLAAIEAGRLDPRFDALLALADGLGVAASALVKRTEAETKGGDA